MTLKSESSFYCILMYFLSLDFLLATEDFYLSSFVSNFSTIIETVFNHYKYILSFTSYSLLYRICMMNITSDQISIWKEDKRFWRAGFSPTVRTEEDSWVSIVIFMISALGFVLDVLLKVRGVIKALKLILFDRNMPSVL